jgi:hypothetical protein
MEILHSRITQWVPATVSGWTFCGLYDKLRYYRNDVGNYFKMHFDAPIAKPWDEMSFYTVLINLSEGFVGGETAFHDSRLPDNRWDNVAETGRALFFEHEGWLHEGTTIESGHKYMLSLNVFYKKLTQEELAAGPPVVHCGLCGEDTRVIDSPCGLHKIHACGCYSKLVKRQYKNCYYC